MGKIDASSPVPKYLQLREILLDLIEDAELPRTADGEPMAIERCHIPAGIAPNLPDIALSDVSLYDVLEKRFGVVFDAGEQTIEAGIVDTSDARLLDLPRGSAVLFLQRRSFMNGSCVELAVSTYRADRYQLQSILEIPRRNRVRA